MAPRFELELHEYAAAVREMQFLVSICAFEEPSYVSFLVANTLHHTSASTHVVLNYINAAKPSHSVVAPHARLHVNPRPIRVMRAHSSILDAHAANVKWMRHLPFEYVILQASNMVWCRQGMEFYVSNHTKSVRSFFNSTRLPCGECMCNRIDSARMLPDPCFVPAFGDLDVTVLVQGKHEGSFYPIGAFLDAYDSATAIHAWNRSGHECKHVNVSDLHDVKWPLEEVVVPTWFANFYDDAVHGHPLTHWIGSHVVPTLYPEVKARNVRQLRPELLEELRFCADLPVDRYAVKAGRNVATQSSCVS